MTQWEVVVIGGGPGGTVCAVKAAQLGFKVGLIEKHSALGGTCLHVGCIPSKALLDSSELFFQAKTDFQTHGVHFRDVSFSWEEMLRRKEEGKSW